MVTHTTDHPTLDALAEDRRAAWVPDVLGWADALGLAVEPAVDATLGHIETIGFPKPDGNVLVAPVLQVPNMIRLHRAVEFLRDDAESSLAPGVCGYRRGAEGGFSYSRENIRFHEMAQGEAEHAQFVLLADVQKFFWHVSWHLVLDRAASVTSRSDVEPLREFALAAGSSGLNCLPAGYADARLLGNVVLRAVDDAITNPFVRWVDDYQISCATEEDAVQQLEALRSVLSADGMKLNERKTSIVPAAKIAGRRDSLQSVYHPDVERPEQVRAALRAVFTDAALDPIKNRRALRFTLPRLAEQRDDCAVDWALKILPEIPWEAPRLCAYLSAFAERPEVARRVETLLLKAAAIGDIWVAVRLAVLACYTRLSDTSASALAEVLHRTESRSLWGLGVRALAVSGHASHVERLFDGGISDSRAAAGALVDLGLGHRLPRLPDVHGATLATLADGPAPLPEVDAIL